MARLARLALPNQLHLLLQRGHNRQPIFADAADRQMLLALLGENARRFGVALHAYVLMDDHFRLLATPASADALPQWMQAVGRRYVRHFNDRHGRSGTLWDGRYRATILQAERYLLPCMAAMDLRPVRAGLVQEARLYPWSSHAHYLGQASDRILTPPALYWRLGNTPFEREAAYAERVHQGVAPAAEEALDRAVEQGWVLGDPAFLAVLQQHTGRRLVKAAPGRPRRSGPSAPA